MKKSLPYPENNPQKIVINPEIILPSNEELEQIVRPEFPKTNQSQKKIL